MYDKKFSHLVTKFWYIASPDKNPVREPSIGNSLKEGGRGIVGLLLVWIPSIMVRS